MRNVMGMVRHDYWAVVEARAVLMAIAARHLCNGKPVSAKGLFWRSSKLSANGVGEGMWGKKARFKPCS
jgi:hypothetical protein